MIGSLLWTLVVDTLQIVSYKMYRLQLTRFILKIGEDMKKTLINIKKDPVH